MIKKRIRDWCDKEYPKRLTIVHNTKHRPVFNHACHYNAQALVKAGEAIAMVECVMIDEKSATLHYINIDENGDYFDATLGYAWTGGDYRMIRIISDTESNAYDRLVNKKREICNKSVGFIYKLFRIHDLL